MISSIGPAYSTFPNILNLSEHTILPKTLNKPFGYITAASLQNARCGGLAVYKMYCLSFLLL